MGDEMSSEPKKAGATNSIIDLDEPVLEELDWPEPQPSTARPEYEPDKFARDLESAAGRMTEPPSPTYEMLRDSCKSAIAEEVPIDEEQILRPSKRYKIVPPPR